MQARVEQRAQVILLTADGLQNKDIAVGVGLDQRAGWERDLYAPAAPPPQRVVFRHVERVGEHATEGLNKSTDHAVVR